MDSSLYLLLLLFLSAAIWLYLIFARGGFWRMSQRLGGEETPPQSWPAVTALVPARNEAGVIAESLSSLLRQDYPGAFRVLVIDDHSDDGTAEVAHKTARDLGLEDRLRVIQADDLPAGWAGKLWALSQGLQKVEQDGLEERYLWLSDADIAHSAETLRQLVTKAEGRELELVSLMALLRSGGFWGKLLIPPFIYFFQKLYPFSWTADPKARTAAAAGGCVLLKRDAFEAAGGFAAIRGALIDDCTLAALIKRRSGGSGRIWLGLTQSTWSLRPYRGLEDIWDMVARSAYSQLRYSPFLLVATLTGLAVTYFLPTLLLFIGGFSGNLPIALGGAIIWAAMAASLIPTLRLYAQSPLWGLLLPLSALFYGVMTFSSAWRHWLGRGGTWKGRHQAKLDRGLEEG